MNLSKEKRAGIKAMFGGKCAYCGIELPEKGWHVDHVESVQRKYKYTREPNTGHGRLVPTGEFWVPERDVESNLFPSCGPCNIHKSSNPLETWRSELERIVGILQRNYPTYRHAVRFGQVAEQPSPIVFWFEKWRADAP